MKPVRVYYRVMRGGSGVYDFLIKWYSRSPYTHTEFAWPLTSPNPPQWFGAQASKIDGVPSGVHARPSDYLGACPFDLFYIEVSQAQVAKMTKFLKAQEGKPYDFRSIARMAIPQIPKHKVLTDFWFCSELWNYTLDIADTPALRAPLKDSDVITPRDSAISTVAILEKNHG